MKRALILGVALCALVGFAEPATKPSKARWDLAANAPKELQSIIDNQGTLMPEALKREQEKAKTLQAEIKETQNRKTDSKEEAAQKRERVQSLRAEMAKSQKRMAQLRAGEIIAIPDIASLPALKAGMAGNVGGGGGKVAQVVDGQNAIADLYYTDYETEVVGNGSSNPIVLRRPITKEIPFWLSGISTAGWSDGRGVPIDLTYLVCVGSKTYPTAIGGQRTVLEVKPFGPDSFVRVKAAE